VRCGSLNPIEEKIAKVGIGKATEKKNHKLTYGEVPNEGASTTNAKARKRGGESAGETPKSVQQIRGAGGRGTED